METAAQRFELGSVSLWTKVTGAGRPVVLLHGITASAYVWDPVAQLLADSGGLRAVAVDQRGHGRTGPAADGNYSADGFAHDVAALADQLGEPVIVAGHSLGARNAIVAAAQYPGSVAGVVAIDFTPYIEPPVLAAVGARVNGGYRAFADLDEVRGYLRQRYQHLPEDAIERRARHGYHQPDPTKKSYWPLADPDAMRLAAAGLSADLAEPLAKVTVPTCLVRGSDSTLVSPEAFRRTRELRPDLPALEIAGADHYVPEEQPAAVADVILRLTGRS